MCSLNLDPQFSCLVRGLTTVCFKRLERRRLARYSLRLLYYKEEGARKLYNNAVVVTFFYIKDNGLQRGKAYFISKGETETTGAVVKIDPVGGDKIFCIARLKEAFPPSLDNKSLIKSL